MPPNKRSHLWFDTMPSMEIDELAEHLNALKRDECYRVDSVLKESQFETTQKVFFVGANGSEQGPYIRKYIKRDAGLGSAYRRIFEAQRAGRRFQHIPRVMDCYDADDTLVVVMEYVRGETLADVVYRCDPSLPLAIDVFRRLCDAVIELHEGFDPPIIHRDLKPGNIILSHDSLTIIDFGIARAFREEADVDTVRFGTRAYAPPEQFGYRQTDVRSDVYALGMLLYFCLVEKTPDAHVREGGFFDSRIPVPVREVMLHATAFDPDDRYASVRALKQAFLVAVRSLECADGQSVAVGAGVESIGAATDGRSCPAKAAIDNAPATRAAIAPDTRPVRPNVSAPPPVVKSNQVRNANQAHDARPATTPGAETSRQPKAPRQPIAPPDRAGRFGASQTMPHPVQFGRLPKRRFTIDAIPTWVGVLWDICLIITLVGMGVTGVDQVIMHPTGEAASYPTWYNVVEYVGVMIMMCGFAFALFDKRLIARFVPAVRRVQGGRGAVIGVVTALASFVSVIVIGVIMLFATQQP